MKILLVDDNLNNMVHFCDLIRLEGHEIKQAYNYETLINLCEAHKQYNSIILDLMFPSGFFAGPHLYDTVISKYYSEVPFIVYTGYSSSAILRNVEKHFKETYQSYRGILQKPAEIEEILMRLNDT